MTEHEHYFKVHRKSTFGLKNVNAVLVCTGVVNKEPCRKSEVKLLAYSDCDQKQKKSGAVTYFWPKKTILSR